MSISAIKILGLLLVIALWAGNCQGQTENESNNDVTLNSESINLNYIWSLTGIEEDGQVIMLLRQEGGDLYGRAKFEPDSGQAWNGLVVGMIEDENVSLALTAQKGDAMCGCRLTGEYDPASESISGDLLQICDGNITRRGNFQAIWINPDLTSYLPAVVELSRPADPSSGQNMDAS